MVTRLKQSIALLLVFCSFFCSAALAVTEEKKDFIKWVDFNASYFILKKIHELDVKYQNSDIGFDFCQALAYLTVKNGNKFRQSTDEKNLKEFIKQLEQGKSAAELTGNSKYYQYNLECYRAIFKEFFGHYKDQNNDIKYGLLAYHPIASGYWYSHYDDFGSGRSYGYKRKHLGHDLMGSIGAPIIAIEGGKVQELGWNKYGGWRVGILSDDGQRYYYYAHLRKGRPFAGGLKLRDTVSAGQVIGYLGMTGYSNKEDVNLKSGKPHLHVGLQLIFDESQIKGPKEIWIDLYAITKLLSHNRAKTIRDEQTKEYKSINLKTRYYSKQK